MGSAQTQRYRRFLRRLRAAREAAGLTQEEVARKLGKGRDQSWVSKVEKGTRRLDIVEVSDFARLYEKPARYFVPEFPPE